MINPPTTTTQNQKHNTKTNHILTRIGIESLEI
jgi:hypothetical protein